MKNSNSPQAWDHLAPSFDDEPDHGLRDPIVRETWAAFLHASLPHPEATILDVGCGTGSLSCLLAGMGHKVTGIDFSPAMISLARSKASKFGYEIEFQVQDATSLQLPDAQFDTLVCRHLLWALPEPSQVLHRWAAYLKPKGRLILIEGDWSSGGGLQAHEIINFLPSCYEVFALHNLTDDPNYWGKKVTDERYAILADKKKGKI